MGTGGGVCFGDYFGLSALGAYFEASLGASTDFAFSSVLGASVLGAYLAGADEPAGLGASGSTSKSGLPTPRFSPAFAWNLVITPAAGLLISTVTLSV